MNPQDVEFLTKEYKALWKDAGVEEPGISSRRTARKPVGKASAKAPIPMPAVPAAPLPASFSSLEAISETIGNCQRCQLCEGRNKIVFGTGNPNSRLLFVGEGPGADEDAQGLPFVGRAGQLLNKIIEAMGYQRADFYIANVVKCRPPQNRLPLPEEVATCSPFLKAQIEVIKPEIIVCLGLCAATTLLGTASSMANLRSRFHKLPWNPEIAVMPTYHPAYLLRNPSAKKMVWDDMKLVKSRLEKGV